MMCSSCLLSIIIHQDIFQSNARQVNIVHSSLRQRRSIPGVLILQGNRMYGRHKKKRLYKCIPDDRRLPIFLIPYQLRLDFQKHLQNKYIIFRYHFFQIFILIKVNSLNYSIHSFLIKGVLLDGLFLQLDLVV